jgi:acyl carrier protein
VQCEEIREVRREVRDYVTSTFYVPDPLADSASLIRTGIIDETEVAEMVAFLESTFGIRIADGEKLPENLDSVARIAAFVCRKKISAEPVEEASDLAVDDVGMSDGSHMADAIEFDELHPG